MEFLAFKALKSSAGELTSPVKKTPWHRQDDGVWTLEAGQDDLKRGVGIHAADWTEAASYAGEGDGIYLVVPYAPPFVGGKEVDFVLGDLGWRSSAASVVAGPWDAQGLMPAEAARMILAAHLQGYRQVKRILWQAAEALGREGGVEEPYAAEIERLERCEMACGVLENVYRGTRVAPLEAVFEMAVRLADEVEPLAAAGDEVACDLRARARPVLVGLSGRAASFQREERLALRARLLARGGWAALVALGSDLWAPKVRRPLGAEEARADLARLSQARAELHRLGWKLIGAEDEEAAVCSAAAALGGVSLDEQDALAAAFSQRPDERKHLVHLLEAARLADQAAQTDASPDVDHADAALRCLDAALGRWPRLMRCKRARSAALAVEHSAARIAAGQTAEVRQGLSARLRGHPGARHAFERMTANEMLAPHDSISFEERARRLLAMEEEYSFWRKDAQLCIARRGAARDLGQAESRMELGTLACVQAMFSDHPDLLRCFHEERIGHILARVSQYYADVPTVCGGFSELFAVCYEHADLVLGDAHLWVAAQHAAWTLGGLAAKLGVSGRRAVWDCVHQQGVTALVEFIVRGERDSVWGDARPLLYLVGLGRDVYSGSVGYLLRRENSLAGVGRIAQLFLWPELADDLLRRAIGLHDVGFVLAAGASWWNGMLPGVTAGEAFAQARGTSRPDAALTAGELAGGNVQPPADALRLLALWPREALTPEIVRAVGRTAADGCWARTSREKALGAAARRVFDCWLQNGYAQGTLESAFAAAAPAASGQGSRRPGAFGKAVAAA